VSTSPDSGLGDRPDFGRSVFVCSKPLQALHCASIVRSQAIANAELYLVQGGIHDAAAFRQFFESSPHGKLFAAIYTKPDHSAAAAAIREAAYDSLFIEDDKVSDYHLFAPLKRRYLSVFEEGIGTYVGPIGGKLTGARWLKWRVISAATGCGLEFGGGRSTDFVFVQSPAAYQSLRPRHAAKARAFPGLMAELDEDRETWDALARGALPEPDRPCAAACLVLGTWGSAPADYSSIALLRDRVMYFKAHPHDGHQLQVDGVTYIDSTWIPAELLVQILAERHRDLLVVHYASSVKFNLAVCGKFFNFLDIAEPKVSQLADSVIEAAGLRAS
jgi:hypothetical protein